MKKLFFLFLIMINLVSAFAKDFHLAVIKNDDDHVTYDLYVETNEHFAAQRLKMFDRLVRDWKYYELTDLNQGVTLKEVSGHDAIILRSSDFEKDRGGHFVIDYLHNGITGLRKEVAVTIDFDGHEWKIFFEGEKVELIDIKVKRAFFQTIGINSINLL